MAAAEWMVLAVLIFCSVAASISRRLFNAVLIFIAGSMAASLLWAMLMAPEIAIVQSLVGSGAVGVMFMRALRRIEAIKHEDDGGHPSVYEQVRR